MKHSVLCVQRNLLPKTLMTSAAIIAPVQVDDIPYDAFNFINRRVVDAKRTEHTTHFSIGTMFPQILPYMVIKCGKEYLMYHRKGKEERLHGLLSMGIGGHIDLPDAAFAGYREDGTVRTATFKEIIQYAAQRELAEEVGYVLDTDEEINFTYAILSPADEVSQVHLGLLATIEVGSKVDIEASDEIIQPFWVHESDLMKHYNKAEEWTKLIIEGKYQDARYT